MDSELARVLSGHRANPRGSRVSRLCLFPRDTSRRDNGSFPFLDDDGETTVVNGNPFGDVNAKFPHSAAAPCLNNKEPGVAAAITATAATSKCASGESRRVFVHAKAHLFPLFFSKPLQGSLFVASHSSISLSRKPISWYLNYARFRARNWRGERDEERAVSSAGIRDRRGEKE